MGLIAEESAESTAQTDSVSNQPSTANNCNTNLTLLYDKYNRQCAEIERLEKLNGELSRKYVQSLQDVESLQQLLQTSRNEFARKSEVLERKLLDCEYQLKVSKERAQARDTHHNNFVKLLQEKSSTKIAQLTKNVENAEKERDAAVIRYATREADVLRLNEEIEKLKSEVKKLAEEREALQKSVDYDTVQELKQSLAQAEAKVLNERQLRKELDDGHKRTLQHLEASQTAIMELRTQIDSLQKRLINEQVEKSVIKDDHKKLLLQLHASEQQRTQYFSIVQKEKESREELYKNVLDEMARLRECNGALSKELELSFQEKPALLSECQRIQVALSKEKEAHESDLKTLKSFEEMCMQVDSCLRRAEKAEEMASDVATERDQAEAEAAECRKQAERMLEITEQLTAKNSILTSENELLKVKNLELNSRIKELDLTLNSTQERLFGLENELEFANASASAQVIALKEQLDGKIVEVQNLSRIMDELKNEQNVLKRKHVSSVKELRSEVQYLRKMMTSYTHAASCDTLEISTTNGVASSSRASSVCSADLLPTLTNARTAVNDETGRESVTQSDNREINNLRSSLDDLSGSYVQQQMVEKIVKLQKQLARRHDKIEFLEEHVRQCTSELMKKSKIIQNYALREEASMLLPENDIRKSGVARRDIPSLMSSLFTNGEKKYDFALSSEINSRLQAVLEDALHKNIALKSNIDTLGEEISRLSRENRQLSLALQRSQS